MILTLKEVAAELKVDYTTALDYVQSGKLPAKQLPGRDGAKGNRWRVRSEDLDAFMAPDVGPLSGPIDRKSSNFLAINRRGQKSGKIVDRQWRERFAIK